MGVWGDYLRCYLWNLLCHSVWSIDLSCMGLVCLCASGLGGLGWVGCTCSHVGFPWMNARLLETRCVYMPVSCCSVHNCNVYACVCVVCVAIFHMWLYVQLYVWLCPHVCYCVVQCVAVRRMGCSVSMSVDSGWVWYVWVCFSCADISGHLPTCVFRRHGCVCVQLMLCGFVACGEVVGMLLCLWVHGWVCGCMCNSVDHVWGYVWGCAHMCACVLCSSLM